MALTSEQSAQLREALIDIESRKTISELDWVTIQALITNISDEDKILVTNALTGKGPDITPLISQKLSAYAVNVATTKVDGYLTAGQFPTEFVARILL